MSRRPIDGTSRAYDVLTEWSGPVRSETSAAQADADRHNRIAAAQGGFGEAIVVREDPEAAGRLVDEDGRTVWPPHGRSCGAAEWVQGTVEVAS